MTTSLAGLPLLLLPGPVVIIRLPEVPDWLRVSKSYHRGKADGTKETTDCGGGGRDDQAAGPQPAVRDVRKNSRARYDYQFNP